VYPIGRPGRFRLTGFFMLIAPAGKRFECPKLDTAPALGMIKGPLISAGIRPEKVLRARGKAGSVDVG